jgi:hypothetical protein
MQRESRAAKGGLLMLGISPPLDSAPDLKAKQVLRLQESSQLVSEDYGGKVAEIWRDIDGKGSIYRKIRLPTECRNHLGRGAAHRDRKQEGHGGPQERLPATRAGGHNSQIRPESPISRRWVGKAIACNSPWPSQRENPVNRRLARYEIVPGCMGDDTSTIACSGLPLSCDSPLQLYVRNGRGKVHIAPAGSTLQLWWETEGPRGVSMRRKGGRAGKSSISGGYGRGDQVAGGIADIHRPLGFNRERFQSQ